MGNKSTKSNKEFQAVIPYTPSSRTNVKRKKTQPRRPTVAPALLKKENSGLSVDSQEERDALGIPNPKRIPLRTPSICEDVGWTPQSSNFDFSNTEGQNRRDLIASCDSECSLITPFLFVGSSTIAKSKEILNQNKITRIVNCSLCAVDNVFESESDFKYLSLNMLDGRQDDISWFVCEVINFVEIARQEKRQVLLHCEKGISRSCSFAIAYIMWASGCQWKTAFDYVRERRKSCSPNTGFTCNLIELDELLFGDSRLGPLMFRVAQHLPHDKYTPVLKLIRNSESRNIIPPHFAFLNSEGVFVIRPSQGGQDQMNILYVWQGRLASEGALNAAIALAQMLLGIFSFAVDIEVVTEGCEDDAFRNYVEKNSAMTIIDYDDLYEVDESANPAIPEHHIANNVAAVSWSNELHIKVPSRLRVNDTIRGNILQGVDKFATNPSVILTESSMFPKLSIPEFKMMSSKVTPTSTPIGKDREDSFQNDKEDEISNAVLTSHAINSLNKDGDEDGLDNNQGEDRIDMTISTPLNVNAPKENALSVGLQIPTQIVADQNAANNEPAAIKVVSETKEISRAKPALFQCSTASDSSLSWQHMGMYDDDDLLEEYMLFLLCPEGPHHVWKGSTFELNELAVVNSVTKFEGVSDNDNKNEKNTEGEEGADNEGSGGVDEEKKILQYAMNSINVGEVPLSSDELHSLFSLKDNIQIQYQNSESEEWWDAFNNGM
mmetsp:Transcript_6085/g.9944  ORF Transcript_6085/g.9944 Transcript_6085/m.9944 type:complete len:721 (+) Transcript_6085:160-2322(+)